MAWLIPKKQRTSLKLSVFKSLHTRAAATVVCAIGITCLSCVCVWGLSWLSWGRLETDGKCVALSWVLSFVSFFSFSHARTNEDLSPCSACVRILPSLEVDWTWILGLKPGPFAMESTPSIPTVDLNRKSPNVTTLLIPLNGRLLEAWQQQAPLHGGLLWIRQTKCQAAGCQVASTHSEATYSKQPKRTCPLFIRLFLHNTPVLGRTERAEICALSRLCLLDCFKILYHKPAHE